MNKAVWVWSWLQTSHGLWKYGFIPTFQAMRIYKSRVDVLSLPSPVSLRRSRHSAICHLDVCTTKMLKGIWHIGQKSPEGSWASSSPLVGAEDSSCESFCRPAPSTAAHFLLTAVWGSAAWTGVTLSAVLLAQEYDRADSRFLFFVSGL